MAHIQAAHETGHQAALGELRPDLPQVFVRIVDRALDSDRDRRFSVADDLEATLDEALRNRTDHGQQLDAGDRRVGATTENPSFEARASVHFSMSSGQIDVPAVEVADFDGDGEVGFGDFLLFAGRFGTSSGDVYGSYGGEEWHELARHLPKILSVEALSLAD